MAKLPYQNQILPENFPDQKFMPQLLAPLNSFMQTVIRSLNKNLTLNENFDGQILTVTTDGTFPLDILWENRNRPTIAFIGSCREVSGEHTTITTAIFLDWEMTASGSFRINNIAGLNATSSNPFNLKIVALVG